MLNIVILGLVSLFTDISSEMIYPLLPLYLTLTLGASPAVLGLVEGIAESIASLIKVFSGFISDKFRKRKIPTMLGYGFSVMGKIFLYLSSNWGHVFFARSFDRLGKGIRTAPRDALIADSSSKGRRGMAFGLHRAMDTLGAVFGVILAYYFLKRTNNSYSRIFFYALIPAVLGVILLLFVKERKARETAKKIPLTLRQLLSVWRALDKRLKNFLLISLLFTLGNSSNQFLLLRAKTMGFTIQDVLLLYLLYNLVFALSAFPAGRLSDKIGSKKIIVSGYIFYGLVYFGFAAAKNLDFLWLLFANYGLYTGLTEGVEKAFISDISPQDRRATLLGLHATILGLGLFPASLLAGILWKFFGPAVPFYFGAITGFSSAVLFFFLI